MERPLIKKECEDCSHRAEIEVLDSILDKIRIILQVQEGEDIVKVANAKMIELYHLKKDKENHE